MYAGLVQVYLDHAATTPVDPEVLDRYVEVLREIGNPSSTHGHGRRMWTILDDARASIAADLNADAEEVIFTSGGTEADNLAVKGIWEARGLPKVAVSTVEHHAVFESAQYLADYRGADLHWIGVDTEGVVDVESYREWLTDAAPTVGLISVMTANNETGTIQPIAELAAIAGEHGVPFHTDAVQAVGNLDIDFRALGVTALSLSGHKLGAPVGVGALLATRDTLLVPLLHGGGQDRGVRSGTLNAAGAAALAVAVRKATGARVERTAHTQKLRDQLERGVLAQVPGACVRGGQARLSTHSYISFPNTDADSILFGLDFAGFSASAGAACQAGVNRPSHVLMAMGDTEEEASAAVRFTVSATSNETEINELITVIGQVVTRAQAAHATRRKG